jgi:hypothetical protein
MNPSIAGRPGLVFHECDFCKIKGVPGRDIINKDGWYFCKPCLLEIEQEMKKRDQGRGKLN